MTTTELNQIRDTLIHKRFVLYAELKRREDALIRRACLVCVITFTMGLFLGALIAGIMA